MLRVTVATTRGNRAVQAAVKTTFLAQLLGDRGVARRTGRRHVRARNSVTAIAGDRGAVVKAGVHGRKWPRRAVPALPFPGNECPDRQE